MDGAKKTGTKYEDAIEDAIIAMNEPKDASVPALRHYLNEYHLEYRVSDRPFVLKKALDRCEARGWIKRVTGKGFSGTFRLAFPYYPDPKELGRILRVMKTQGKTIVLTNGCFDLLHYPASCIE